jgi:HEAT repeat protein
MLRAKDSPLKVRLMALAGKQHVIKISYTPAHKWNAATAGAFAVLRTNAQSAVPALLEIANRNISLASRDYAIAALGFIGPPAEEAVPSRLRWATNANPTVRACAVQSLGGIGAELDRVVPVLINAVRDPYFRVRNNAVVALGHFGAEAKIAVATLVVPVLTNAVHDSSLRVRFSAIQSHGMCGQDAKLAVPALLELLNDSEADVRGSATNALKQVDPEAAAKAGVK